MIARQGRDVWAIDADSTPNLAVTLGLSREEAAALMPVPRSILDTSHDPDGKRVLTLNTPPAAVMERFGAVTPDAVRLLLMGRVDHAGAG